MQTVQVSNIEQDLEQLIIGFLDPVSAKSNAEIAIKTLDLMIAQNIGMWFGAVRGYAQLAQQAQALKAKLELVMNGEWGAPVINESGQETNKNTIILDHLRIVATQTWEQGGFANVFFAALIKQILNKDRDISQELAVKNDNAYVCADAFRIILNRELTRLAAASASTSPRSLTPALSPYPPVSPIELDDQGDAAGSLLTWMLHYPIRVATAFDNQVSRYLEEENDDFPVGEPSEELAQEQDTDPEVQAQYVANLMR